MHPTMFFLLLALLSPSCWNLDNDTETTWECSVISQSHHLYHMYKVIFRGKGTHLCLWEPNEPSVFRCMVGKQSIPHTAGRRCPHPTISGNFWRILEWLSLGFLELETWILVKIGRLPPEFNNSKLIHSKIAFAQLKPLHSQIMRFSEVWMLIFLFLMACWGWNPGI